ncbi:hypothetical protein FRC09_018518 [Ceratobasidium sp. 395]|nr:hypothetical protein FRC09_018518 [Ceratobasidium sp. 395]
MQAEPQTHQIPQKKSHRATHRTDGTKSIHQGYAYIVVVPKPTKETFGIQRYDEPGQGDKRGQFMFWIKIGDSDNPLKRVKSYTNPDQQISIVHIIESPSQKVGKALENALLKGGGTRTEWHPLYAKDEAGAKALCKTLRDFMEKYPLVPNEDERQPLVLSIKYKAFIRDFDDVKRNRYHLLADSLAAALPKSEGQIPVVYILVTPEITSKSYGITGLNYRQYTTYHVVIGSSLTTTGSAYAFFSQRFTPHNPSFSYNGFRVHGKAKVEKVAKAMCDTFESLLEHVNRVSKDDDPGEETGETGKRRTYRLNLTDGETVDRVILELYVNNFDLGPIEVLNYVNIDLEETGRAQIGWTNVSVTQEMLEGTE